MPLPFIASLAATVAALVGVVWSGHARRRHLHYTLVVVMLACLAVAIWLAEQHGRGLVYDGAAAAWHRWHFRFVALTLALVPLVAVTGVLLARARGPAAPARRLWHKRAAWAFVLSTVVTFGLGLGMTLLAEAAPAG